MFWVYVLKSTRNKRFYVGFTGKEPEKRLEEHNRGCNRFTRMNRPYVLVYEEEYGDRNFAVKRERFLKTGHGKIFLKRKLAESAV